MDLADILSAASRRTARAFASHHHHAWDGTQGSTQDRERRAEHLRVMLRAMLYAARVKEDFGRRQQDALLREVGDLLPDERCAMRAAFAEPVNVMAYAESVPRGLEREVYTVSMLALRDDISAQAAYLPRLAVGLRLTPAACRRIHGEHEIPLLTH